MNLNFIIYFRRVLLTIILSLSACEAAAAALSERTEPACATGCLVSTDADWSRVGLRVLGSIRLFKLTPSSAATCISKSPERDLALKANLSSIMSPVQDQKGIGTCTAFAIVAAIEAVIPGERFSETELFLRMVTDGAASRDDTGTCLCDYVPLLRRGVVKAHQFFSYETYESYVEPRRKHTALVLAESNKFTLMIDALKRLYPDIAPSELRPYCTKELRKLPLKGVVAIEILRGYYDELYLNPFPLNIKCPDLLKYTLNAIPVVIGVKTFSRTEKDSETGSEVTERWWSKATVRSHKFIIDIPPSEFKESGGHAICLCGYDDSIAGGIGAFRFKNSWNTDWGEKGYAWITYPYVLTHGFSALAIIPHPAKRVRDETDTTEETFYDMLAEFKERTHHAH
jgi:hypothetical protein